MLQVVYCFVHNLINKSCYLLLFPGTDLESLRAVFNEKEKELSVAVAKVDELTRQLEDLRKGSRDQYKQANGQSNVTVELEKLRRELVVSYDCDYAI